jgi:hypothetical protein
MEALVYCSRSYLVIIIVINGPAKQDNAVALLVEHIVPKARLITGPEAILFPDIHITGLQNPEAF